MKVDILMLFCWWTGYAVICWLLARCVSGANIVGWRLRWTDKWRDALLAYAMLHYVACSKIAKKLTSQKKVKISRNPFMLIYVKLVSLNSILLKCTSPPLWPLTLKPFWQFPQSHSRDEYLWQVSSKSLH